MKVFCILLVILFIIVLIYVILYPKTDCIYKDKFGNKIKTLDINNFVVTIVYILDDGQEVTSPQNWDLLEFIKTFKLWKIL